MPVQQKFSPRHLMPTIAGAMVLAILAMGGADLAHAGNCGGDFVSVQSHRDFQGTVSALKTAVIANQMIAGRLDRVFVKIADQAARCPS